MGSKFIVSITVYALKNFITLTEAEKAYAVQTDDKRSNHKKSLVEIEKNSGVNFWVAKRYNVRKNQPPPNSYNEMTFELYSLAYLPLMTENRADKKAESSANKIPVLNRDSTLKIMAKPIITSIPKNTSYQIIFLLYKIGSSNDVKKAPVDKQANVIEIFATFIAS